MKAKTKTIIEIVAIIALAVLGFAYMAHKDNTAREYAENNNCHWVAQGGLNICK